MDSIVNPAPSASLFARDVSLDDKTLSNLREAQYPQHAIYLVACSIFLAALFNAVSVLHARLAMKPSAPRHTPGSQGEPNSRTNQRRQHMSLRRLPIALINGARVVACRVTVPVGPVVRFTLIEVTICVAHLLAILAFDFINSRNIAGMLDPTYWANRAAVLAISQLSFIIALSGKNNVISMLTGISYEKLNVFHRAASRTMLILIWVHMWGRVRLGLTADDSLIYGWLHSGIVANTSLTLMVILGTRPLRTMAYEFFLASHIILSIIILVAGGIHVTKGRQYLPYVWSACIVWAFDRTLRLVRVLRIRYLASRCKGDAGNATIAALSEDTVGVSMRFAKSSCFLFRFGWRPAQNAYLSVPAVAKWGLGLSTEAHPFTIASIDSPIRASSDKENEDMIELKFLIRVRDGFTRRLHEHAVRAGGRTCVSAYVDGPYGDPPSLYTYPNVILVTGGSGVSFTLPLLLDLVKRSKEGSSSTLCRKVKFIWYIRERVHFEAISEDLNGIEAQLTGNLLVEISVFVTGKADSQKVLGVPSLHSSIEKQDEEDLQVASGEPSTLTSKERPGTENEKESPVMNVATPESRILRLEYGRPVIAEVLRDEISLCADSVAVCVSGPQSLLDDSRSALRESSIAGPMAVLRGGPSVFFHAEHFSM